VTIREVMEKTITPATNTMWNVPERPTDEQWAGLEEASITLLVAAETIARGGAGQHDMEWAGNSVWAAFNEALIKAGLDALKAIRARDAEALTAAGDVLYPPCEGCHLQFNPGVAGERQ
jgi:phage-related protein